MDVSTRKRAATAMTGANAHLAAVNVGAAQLRRRRGRLLLGGHDDEAEATRAAGLAVVDDLRRVASKG
jgi:predicted LPLAT superfamily acyltransferase